MGQILGVETGMDMPSLVNSSMGGTLTILLIVVVIAIAVAIVLYIYMTNKKFNRKIVLFENIAGKGWEVTLKDRARLVKIGDGGEEILYLRKSKVYRTAYARKQGKNEHWFAIGQDGYWYNFLLGDLDAKMGMLDIEPIDRDMRYMHVAIRKNITERYRKISFMEKYGSILINGVFLIIMLVGLWILVDQIGELVTQATHAQEPGKLTLDAVTTALSKIDSIYSGGSGIIPA